MRMFDVPADAAPAASDAAGRRFAPGAPFLWPDPPRVLAPGAALLGAVLDEIDYGVMVVDPSSAALVHANRLALDELQVHRTLTLTDGRVEAADGVTRRALGAALAAVALGRRSLLTLRPAGATGNASTGGTVQVSVVPVATEGGAAHALLVFGKRQVADALAVGFFARAHALTPTEDAVLLALCRGVKPTQIAVDHGVAISTIRTHVNSIRVKTGTGSIRDLVNRVSALPPMAPVLRRCTH
jgi:DNA-binding CsgD family transcriptional regulator